MAGATPGGEIRKFGNFGEIANFLWSVADLLCGDHGKVAVPMSESAAAVGFQILAWRTVKVRSTAG